MNIVNFDNSSQKNLSFCQLSNVCCCSFGREFAWALQTANVSAIYEYLGATPEQLPILWIAAPISGLIVQLIIGYNSDRTWTPLGKRRPYFLVGAVLTSLSLVVMPNSSSLWMAVATLWVLDIALNICMEPFRPFLVDVVPEKQRTQAFSINSFYFALGAVLASIMPWILDQFFGINPESRGTSTVALSVKISFYIGAGAVLFSNLWTVLTTSETPPEQKIRVESASMSDLVKSLVSAYQNIPRIMQQLTIVLILTRMGLFCFFLYFTPAIGHQIFGAVDESSSLYTEGVEWAGICICIYNIICLVFSLFTSNIVRHLGRPKTHAFALFCGGFGLICFLFVHNRYQVILFTSLFGIAWSSISFSPLCYAC